MVLSVTLLGHLWQLLRLQPRDGGPPTSVKLRELRQSALYAQGGRLNLLRFDLVLSARLLPGSSWGSAWAFAVHTVVREH